MLFWSFALALITVTVIAVLWPLLHGGRAAARLDSDIAFYEARQEELARLLAAGEISEAEYRGALAEQGRRLIARGDGLMATGADVRRRKAAALAMLIGVPILGLGLYLGLGAPAMPDRPLASRPVSPQNFDLATALQKIETHLAKNPNDGKGFEVVAPVYMRMGRYTDAVHAYRRVVALLGATPGRLADLGESLVAEAGGIVNAEARQAFEKAVELDRGFAKARFYLALAREQDGDVPGAFAALDALARDLDEGPAKLRVNAEIARLRAEGKAPMPEGGAIAALPEAERREAIRAMVAGLDSRLAASGGTLEEWGRLVQARIVLGERDGARAALARARLALAGDGAAPPVLDALERRIAAMGEGP
jgi:cytochrome c-type biogenesis protein CcmH